MTEAPAIGIVGSGGHARIVVDALLRAIEPVSFTVFDQDPARVGGGLAGVEVRALEWDNLPQRVHVAVGSNETRRRLGERVESEGRRLQTVIHPLASVSPSARLGAGVFVGAGAVVGPSAEVETGTIVNHGAIVDHDCELGKYVHVAPNATLGGEVSVGQEALLGAGSVILPGLSVGEGAVVGAGAVVIRPVPPVVTVVGVPARAADEY